MSETIREYIGVSAVSFTPTGGSPISFPMVDEDGIEHSVSVEQIRYASASGKYHQFVHTTRVTHEVTVKCKDMSVLDDADLAVNTEGVLTWTLVGAGLGMLPVLVLVLAMPLAVGAFDDIVSYAPQGAFGAMDGEASRRG